MEQNCKAPDCDKPPYGSRSWCNTHYMRLYRYGSTDAPSKKPNTSWEDIAGQRFGTLVAQSFDSKTSTWTMLCDCGNVRETRHWNLKQSGDHTACGDFKAHPRLWTKPSYRTAHARVKYAKGSAKECLCACGKQASQWAYNHNDPDEHFMVGASNNPIAYSMDPEYYFASCAPCHKRFDLARIVNDGVPLSHGQD
jgi:hypothetical protein